MNNKAILGLLWGMGRWTLGAESLALNAGRLALDAWRWMLGLGVRGWGLNTIRWTLGARR